MAEALMKNISEWLASHGVSGAEFVKADRRWSRTVGSAWYRAPSPAPGAGLDFRGAEHPGHLLVTASRVGQRPVFDSAGARIGEVFDISLEKRTGTAVHVLVAMGGVLGFGRSYRPLPWELFVYAPERRGYRLPMSGAEIEAIPCLGRDELEWFGGGYRSPFGRADARIYADLPFI
jgi:hypothetical protein